MISGIKIEFQRSALGARGGARAVYKRTGGTILQVLGATIKKRVTKRGDLAGQPVAAYPTGPPIAVNDRYPISGGELRDEGGKFRVFKSSRELHRTTRLGSFWVTGGMWGGFSVVVGPKTSQLRFRGRSHGQQSRILRFAFAERVDRNEGPGLVGGRATFRVARRSRAKISNALKAASVFRSRGVSLLAISQQELASLTEGLIAGTVRAITAVGPAAVEWKGAITDKMTREVFRRLL